MKKSRLEFRKLQISLVLREAYDRWRDIQEH